MSKIWAIVNKELKTHLDNVGGYLLIGLFLAIAYYLFLKTFFVNAEVTVQALFSDLSLLLSVFVAAVTMGSFAGERDQQTIEYLITKPITTVQLLWGKILGHFIYALIPLFLTLPIPFFVSRFGNLDGGEVLAGYLSATLLTFALVCLGVGFSALVKKPVMAFLLTAVVLLVLNMVSGQFFALNLSPGLAAFFSHLGIMDHYFSLLRGVLSFNDLAYFALLALLGYLAGFLALSSWRFGRVKFSLAPTLFLAITVLILVSLSFTNLSWLQWRLDLTAQRRYTLSSVTKEILQQPGKIKIDVYISDNLPTQFQSTIREIKNTLADYARVGGSQIELNFLSPTGQEQALADLGIMATPFSVVSDDTFQQQTGYIGAVVKNEDESKTQAVNFTNINGIDYDLTRAINVIKTDVKPKVGYTINADEIILSDFAPSLVELLSPAMDFEAVRLPIEMDEDMLAAAEEAEAEITTTVPDLSQYEALIIIQPYLSYTPESIQALHDYYEAGGDILYLTAGNDVNPQLLMVETTTFDLDVNSLFADYGLQIDHNLIQDFQANSIINSNPQSDQFVPLAYESWPRPQLTQAGFERYGNLPTEVTMFWPSSLSLTPSAGWTPLYQTSPYAHASASADMISAEPHPEPLTSIPTDLSQYVLAAERLSPAGGRLMVVANFLVIADQLLNGPQAQNNLVFGMVALENMTAAQQLSQIQARQIAYPRFVVDDSYDLNHLLLLCGAPLLSAVLLGGLGFARYYRRRQIARQLAAF